MDPQSVQSLLIWLPNWVGDVVMATPTLRALREHFCLAHVGYVGREAALAVLTGTRWADEMIVDTSARRGGRIELLRRLRQDRYDLTILLPNSFRTALLARLGGARGLVGYRRDGRGLLLSRGLKVRRQGLRRVPVPTIDSYLALAAAVGCETADRRMELPVSEAAASEADDLLAAAPRPAASPLVLLNPGGSYGPSKLWPAGRYAELADRLVREHRARIIVHAAPSEQDAAAAVVSRMRARPVMDFSVRSSSLALLKALIARCDLVVTNDTGPRHLAAALSTPVVTVFGSTDPTWAQIDYDQERIVRVDVPCGPCQKKRCPLPPGPDFHACMERVSVEMVFDAAERLLNPLGENERDRGMRP